MKSCDMGSLEGSWCLGCWLAERALGDESRFALRVSSGGSIIWRNDFGDDVGFADRAIRRFGKLSESG